MMWRAVAGGGGDDKSVSGGGGSKKDRGDAAENQRWTNDEKNGTCATNTFATSVKRSLLAQYNVDLNQNDLVRKFLKVSGKWDGASPKELVDIWNKKCKTLEIDDWNGKDHDGTDLPPTNSYSFKIEEFQFIQDFDKAWTFFRKHQSKYGILYPHVRLLKKSKKDWRHAVCALKANKDASGKPYILCQNSWGADTPTWDVDRDIFNGMAIYKPVITLVRNKETGLEKAIPDLTSAGSKARQGAFFREQREKFAGLVEGGGCSTPNASLLAALMKKMDEITMKY